MGYRYSAAEDRMLFNGATINSGNSLGSILKNHTTNNGSNPIFIKVSDTIPPNYREQSWKLAPNEKTWNLYINQETIWENGRRKEQYSYQDQALFSKIVYFYKDTLLTETIAFRVSTNDTIPERREVFIYNSNNQLTTHFTQFYNQQSKKLITHQKSIHEYDEQGYLLTTNDYKFDPEEKDSLVLGVQELFRYNQKGALTYYSIKAVEQGLNYNTTYEYDTAENCIAHHINNFETGSYRFVKKEFVYDSLNRVISHTLKNRMSEKDTFKIVNTLTFQYKKGKAMKAVRYLGDSTNAADNKNQIAEFDSYGNIQKYSNDLKNGYKVIKYNYDIPIKEVTSKHRDFYQNYTIPTVEKTGIISKKVYRKISHAITSEIIYRYKDDEYYIASERKFFYGKQ